MKTMTDTQVNASECYRIQILGHVRESDGGQTRSSYGSFATEADARAELEANPVEADPEHVSRVSVVRHFYRRTVTTVIEAESEDLG